MPPGAGGLCYGRSVRRTRAAIFSAAMVAAMASASAAAAQTTGATTTMPPVRSIPVTPAPTTTAAPARTAGAESTAPAGQSGQAAADLADTGIAADQLVPLGLLLIAVGAGLQGVARRPRRAYALL